MSLHPDTAELIETFVRNESARDDEFKEKLLDIFQDTDKSLNLFEE